MKYLALALCLLLPVSAYSELYRCKNAAGETEFKDKPCQNNQKTEATYTATKSRGPTCKDACDREKWLCVSGNTRNTAIVNQCLNEQKFCRFACDNPVEAARIQRNVADEQRKTEKQQNYERRLRDAEGRLSDLEVWQD